MHDTTEQASSGPHARKTKGRETDSIYFSEVGPLGDFTHT